MKAKTTKTYAAIIALVAAGIITAPAQSSDLDQLKATMQTMQKNMEEMQKKINELEKEKGAAAAPGTNAAGGGHLYDSAETHRRARQPGRRPRQYERPAGGGSPAE